ncbi:Aste57867_8304 [Aphanomyces stellatus]|uniref:Dol-P-Glc:Glc(2)Man(9)GlcNAc(2)-PP-Dol alpha-1,2-glucosyltransferase n=1 Tax=Aphanomyces stellatus TaxID=120398 RepID=A0A485KJV4_9STRA|nr:hypothetical protein As57867_008273 [Aphanomyces stellatus]VFT85191.1 Aste57867_8304 [Aphanomyces stellatus]
MSWAVSIALAAACAYFGIGHMFSSYAANAYMDEIFHYPQTKRFCEGMWYDWDPKITTFPGIYVIGVIFARGVDNVLSFQNYVQSSFCSLNVLRSLNIVFGAGNVYLILILRSMNEYSPSEIMNSSLHGVMIALFPFNFFFNFLYYTDTGSLFFVLLMYYTSQVGRSGRLRHGVMTSSNILSVICGYIAVSIRQTNIIWVLFVMGTEIVHDMETTHFSTIYGSEVESARRFHNVLFSFVLILVKNTRRIVFNFWPHMTVLQLFGMFLIFNGSITVGMHKYILRDKSNHASTFHFSQILYFISASATGLGISCISYNNLINFSRAIRQFNQSRCGVFMFILFFGAFVVCIHFFSPVHQFLLADNRHYTFYIWHRFFLKHSMMKLIPAPAYVYLAWLMWNEMSTTEFVTSEPEVNT